MQNVLLINIKCPLCQIKTKNEICAKLSLSVLRCYFTKKSRKLNHVGLLNIFLIYNNEEFLACLAMSDQAQLICYLHTKINSITQLILKI